MRYLTVGAVRLSRIGLGTWQFGSRGWGYGASYAGPEAHAIVRRALELGEDRESALLATKIFPVLPVAVTGPAALPRLVRARLT